MLDALKLKELDLVGAWVGAELAARHPEKIRKLVVIGATGVLVQGALIGDLFMHAQPSPNTAHATRPCVECLFAGPNDSDSAKCFPKAKASCKHEVRR